MRCVNTWVKTSQLGLLPQHNDLIIGLDLLPSWWFKYIPHISQSGWAWSTYSVSSSQLSSQLTLQAPPYFQWCAHTLGLFPPFLDLPHCSKPLLFDDTSEWFMSLRMIYYGTSKTFSGAFLIKYFLKSKSLLKVLLYSFSKSLILLFITGRQRICNKVKI